MTPNKVDFCADVRGPYNGNYVSTSKTDVKRTFRNRPKSNPSRHPHVCTSHAIYQDPLMHSSGKRILTFEQQFVPSPLLRIERNSQL